MSIGWRDQAFALQAAGDIAGARAALAEAGEALLTDSQSLQLLALTSSESIDEQALFEFAALEVEPHDANAFFNLGVMDQAQGDDDRAVVRYEQVLRLDPVHLGALNNLSDLLRRQGRADEAWTLLQRYRDRGGPVKGLEIRFAKIADDCGLVAEARDWFGQALQREPANRDLRWEQALQQLRDEEFSAGWRGYELRRGKFPHEALAIVSYDIPEWRGETLQGCSLLVHKEQGLGDTIMFASCLADLPADRGPLHLAVHPALSRLFAHNFRDAQVWPSRSAPGFENESYQPWRKHAGPIDRQLPFGSLPLHLRGAGFPMPRVYLTARPEDRDAWRRRLPQLVPDIGNTLRVGVVLSARRDGPRGPGIADGFQRSIPPHLLCALATPGITWLGLHDRANAPEFGRVSDLRIVNTSDWLHDLADTAALIAELDVIVSVDTAVAHLAAAMGKTVLLALPRLSDWRWGRDRHDSYWYQHVEIFRQQREGDWTGVVAALGRRLAEIAARQAAGREDGQ